MKKHQTEKKKKNLKFIIANDDDSKNPYRQKYFIKLLPPTHCVTGKKKDNCNIISQSSTIIKINKKIIHLDK